MGGVRQPATGLGVSRAWVWCRMGVGGVAVRWFPKCLVWHTVMQWHKVSGDRVPASLGVPAEWGVGHRPGSQVECASRWQAQLIRFKLDPNWRTKTKQAAMLLLLACATVVPRQAFF